MYLQEGYWDKAPVSIGYVRTSTKGQNPELQRRELLAFGCEKIFEEQISARKADRPELRAALEYVGEGDVLMVWKLKAASAGLFKDLVKKVEFLKQ
jgi:DNA invertase Pin-like site-specific DNA recombinase